RVALHQRRCAREAPELTSPGAANVQGLSVDRVVHVDGARSGVRVMAGDHIPAAISGEKRPLFERPRGACGLHDDVDTLAMSERADVIEALESSRCREIEYPIGSERFRQRQAI